MSGGHFDYKQSLIEDIADNIENYVFGEDLDNLEEVNDYIHNFYGLTRKQIREIKENKHTLTNWYEFSEETIQEFKKGIEILKKAYVYAQRIDRLLSGDDGEESFHKRLKEDLEEL